MTGLTIVDVKVIGICSKHRSSDKDKLEAPRKKDGTLWEDEHICCFVCDIGIGKN